jgi:rhodanese-related sulfurtransferase
MRAAEVQKIILEALAVGVVGAGFAFAANKISPNGLALNRNYFPSGVAATTNTATATLASASPARVLSPATTTAKPGDDEVVARLKGKGLTWISREDVERMVGEAGVVLVDARDEEKFEKGHLPGAYELDPYHPERTMGTVLPACEAATKVVVYCAGGECEDADGVAILLRDGGIAAERLVVYGGGMDEWLAQHKPVETGARP